MTFIADKQTLEDLNILGKYKNNSLYSIFNQVKTIGGGQLLDNMFHHPLTDEREINQRSALFRYFQEKALLFPLDEKEFSAMETYLNSGAAQNRIAYIIQTFRRKSLKAMGLLQEYNLFNNGFNATVKLLVQLRIFLSELQQNDPENPFHEEIDKFNHTIQNSRFNWLHKVPDVSSLNLLQLAGYDHLLRNVFHEEMKYILQLVYKIDVCIAVSDVARTRNLVYANALPHDRHFISITDCRHPGIEKAIGNSIDLTQHTNVLFLTGANMAGKSTFMKSFGVAVYMAHMGFPVAAAAMEFSVKDGIYSSINVPDNLDMGYSHFYAEVLRVKKVAEEVSSGKDLVVIFDELFKGTNVKDAYDATLACTQAFSAYKNCSFIISTHIIEVGTALKESNKNVLFRYMPTVMQGVVPVYTYRMQEGITSDRHGMMIIENEKIFDILQ